MINVNIRQSIKAGVLNNFAETWRKLMPTYDKQMELFIKKIPADGPRVASYPMKETVPFPTLWMYGEPRKFQNFRDRVTQITKVPYSLGIPWSYWDEKDDQLNDLRIHVQTGVKRFASFPYLLISEYLNGVAVENPALGLAYDGVGLVSAVDGDGAARFGRVGGNIVTGSGATVAGMLNDVPAVQRAFLDFVNPTDGKPIFDETDVAYENLMVVVPTALNQVAQKASKAEFIKSDPSNNVSESNYLIGTFQYQVNQFLTDTSDYYVVLMHPYVKPFAVRQDANVESIIADYSNSDHARDYKENILYSDLRIGVGPYFPAAIIKVNN